MKIRCIKCKKQFEQGDGRTRFCGCSKYHRVQFDGKYLADISRYFQDPIYQNLRLSHSENLSTEMRFVRPVITIINKPSKRK